MSWGGNWQAVKVISGSKRGCDEGETVMVWYPALDIFQFWKDLQSKPICLASCPVASIHIVPKGQNKTNYVPQMSAL